MVAALGAIAVEAVLDAAKFMQGMDTMQSTLEKSKKKNNEFNVEMVRSNWILTTMSGLIDTLTLGMFGFFENALFKSPQMKEFWGRMSQDMFRFTNFMGQRLQPTLDMISDAFKNVINWVMKSETIKTLLDNINKGVKAWRDLFEGRKSLGELLTEGFNANKVMLEAVIDDMVALVSGFLDRSIGAFIGPERWEKVKKFFKDVFSWENIKDTVLDLIAKIQEAFSFNITEGGLLNKMGVSSGKHYMLGTPDYSYKNTPEQAPTLPSSYSTYWPNQRPPTNRGQMATDTIAGPRLTYT